MDIKHLLLLHGEKPLVGLVVIFALFMVVGHRLALKDTPNIPEELKRIEGRYKSLRGPGIGKPLPEKEKEWNQAWFGDIGKPELRQRDNKFWVTFDCPPVGPPPVKKKESVFVDPPKNVKAEAFRTFARVTWKRHPNHVWLRARGAEQTSLFQKVKKRAGIARVKGFLVARKNLSTNKVTVLNDGKPISPIDLVRSVKKLKAVSETVTARGVPGEMPGETPPGYDGGVPGEVPAEGIPGEGIPGEGAPEEGEYGRPKKGVGKSGIVWYPAPVGDFVFYDRDLKKGHKYTYKVMIIVDSPKEKGKRGALKWSEEVEVKPSLLWSFQSASPEGASIAVFRFMEIEHHGGYWQTVNMFVRCGDPIGFKAERKVYAIDMEKAKEEADVEKPSELDITLAKRFIKSEKEIVDFDTGAVVADMFKGVPVLTVATAGEKGSPSDALCSAQAKDLLVYINREGSLEQMLAQKRKDFIGTHDIKLPEAAKTRRERPSARAVGRRREPREEDYYEPDERRSRGRRDRDKGRSRRDRRTR